LKNKEIDERSEREKYQKWYNVGIVKISDALNNQKNSIEDLAKTFLYVSINYFEVEIGAIYIINDMDEADPHLEMISSHALNKEKHEKTRIEINEGQIGACFHDNEIIRLNNLPDSYAKMESGLGGSSIKHMLLVPIKFNEIIVGVLELLSFQEIEDYKIELIKKACETFTSIYSTIKIGERTNFLLEKQNNLTEEMQSREEELRQNLEEMEATQEESKRQKEEFEEKEKALILKIEKLKKQRKK
jgi:methyl-accepting chemotaxis protein